MLACLVAAQSILLLITVIVLVRLRADLSDMSTLSRMTFWAVRDLLEELGRAQNKKSAD